MRSTAVLAKLGFPGRCHKHCHTYAGQERHPLSDGYSSILVSYDTIHPSMLRKPLVLFPSPTQCRIVSHSCGSLPRGCSTNLRHILVYHKRNLFDAAPSFSRTDRTRAGSHEIFTKYKYSSTSSNFRGYDMLVHNSASRSVPQHFELRG